MPRPRSESDHQAVLLRTSADVGEHALVQLEALGEEYPEYMPDVVNFRFFVQKVVDAAKLIGYIGKTRGRR